MLSVNDLVAHMNKFKDATIIVGPNVIYNNTNEPTKEEYSSLYTNKSLKRSPEKFWEFFKKYIYADPTKNNMTLAHRNITHFCELGIVNSIITQATDGFLNYGGLENVINFHGNSQLYICQGCKIKYTSQYVMGLETPIPECEECGKQLRPDVLLFGEKYKDDIFMAVKHQLANTHTLILVDMDFTEFPLVNLLADYNEIKNNMANVDGHNRMLVTIGEPKNYNLDDICFSEFIVNDECGAALSRLLDAFKM